MYLRKPTGRKFTANGVVSGRRVPPHIVGDAIASFYDGLSYRDIQRRIDERHGFEPAASTIYRWVRDYTDLARSFLSDFKADVGDTWAADEMVVRIDGENVWLWNVMDMQTRLLLATHVSKNRTIRDAKALFKEAQGRARRKPRVILTDGLRGAYQEGIESVFGGDTRHEVSLGIRSPINNNMVERLNGTIRERTKVMRGMETVNTAELLLDGFRIHYTHLKPHYALNNRTPAQAAGLGFAFEGWIHAAHLRDDTLESDRAKRQFQKNPFRRRRGKGQL